MVQAFPNAAIAAEGVGLTVSAHICLKGFSWEFGISASLGIALNIGLPVPHHEGAAATAAESCIIVAPGTGFIKKLIQKIKTPGVTVDSSLDISFAIDYWEGDASKPDELKPTTILDRGKECVRLTLFCSPVRPFVPRNP